MDKKNSILLKHNDINLIGESKVSNFIVKDGYQLSDKQINDMINTVIRLGKEYIYLLNKDNKIEKIDLDIFVKLNYLNKLNRLNFYNNIETFKEDLNNFEKFKKDLLSKKVSKEKEELKLLGAFANTFDFSFVFEQNKPLFFNFIMNEMPNEVKKQLKKADEEYKKDNKKMSSEERKQKENDLIKESLKEFYKEMFEKGKKPAKGDEYYDHDMQQYSDIEEKLDGLADEFAKKFIEAYRKAENKITDMYKTCKKFKKEAKKKYIEKLFSESLPNIHTRRMCQNSSSYLSNFVSGAKNL